MDLNADLGESFGAWTMGDDAALLDVVTSANVACGFHAGDPATMIQTCRLAAERGVAVGAHVAYRDLAGFGRRFVDVAPDELYADVVAQVGALQACARVAGTTVAHVKPHGALYNAIVHHEGQADAVVRALADLGGLALLGLPGSVVLKLAADAGIRTLAEGFVDRAYTPEGTLVPRSQPGAVLHDGEEIDARLRAWAADGTLSRFDSLCVHGDSPEAVDVARRTRATLAELGLGPVAEA